ncbi:hypothetical protein [Aeromicrobium fastidiosum]|uniref:Uncharacterized protein n=1 Tax=Aeromicrobium fastidiosum TaxID=52699 RepID=A0A641AKX3_9ACTN|nr:hypothetical protein [Aeromicrobium fastidiosum]KAA1376491.1 hypothetical protein ESP62_013795 [Aeromicrobium fastidiosum]MBP2391591.1 hypothetical protein [Aeromicrobium fastidiosum]
MFSGFELHASPRTDTGHHEGTLSHDAEIGRATAERASQRVVRRATLREMLASLLRSDRRIS